MKPSGGGQPEKGNNMNIPSMIIEAYISVMGEEKWNSLTADQQHDVIMTIVKNLSK